MLKTYKNVFSDRSPPRSCWVACSAPRPSDGSEGPGKGRGKAKGRNERVGLAPREKNKKVGTHVCHESETQREIIRWSLSFKYLSAHRYFMRSSLSCSL